jgi:pimeloyl-ACP methyl ester carboxylesterase
MSSPVLVLIHGYPFDHTLWDLVLPLLDPGVRVLAPDLRGFGGQPVGAEEPSLDRMADDLALLFSQEKVTRAFVAGMSMGGYVALSFAEHYPAQLAGLALISSQAAADAEEARANRRSMIDKVRAQGPDVAVDAVLPKLFAPQNSSSPELGRFPRAGAERAGVAGITWALEAMARRPDRTSIFQSLAVPTLVVHGAEDQFIPVARARELAQLPRHCRYVEIPDAGHGTPLENPALVADALNELVHQQQQVSF